MSLSHPDHSLLCIFLCFGWSGCELSVHSMFHCLVCLFLCLAWYGSQSEAGVSHCLWLGTIFRYPGFHCVFVGDCSCLCVVHQIGLFRFSLRSFVVLLLIHVYVCSLNMDRNLHAAFWSDPCSTSSSEEEIEENRYIQPRHRKWETWEVREDARNGL